MSRNGGLRRPRRFRVVMRTQARRRRRLELAVAAAILGLGVLAYFVVRHFPREQFSIDDVSSKISLPPVFHVTGVTVTGAPSALEAAMEGAIVKPLQRPWGFVELYQTAHKLEIQFPCLSAVHVDGDWLHRRAAFQVVLRRPVARIARNGHDAGWLSDTGVLFTAPSGTFAPDFIPRVELHESREQDYLPLAQMLEAALARGALPEALQAMEYRSAAEGWEIQLADGMKILWGNLSWTEEKLSRLRQVLADASGKFGKNLTADLRYFEYGKILVRPLNAASKTASGTAVPGGAGAGYPKRMSPTVKLSGSR